VRRTRMKAGWAVSSARRTMPDITSPDVIISGRSLTRDKNL
jgi:hypothetical protein